jgi:hypothetical protein
MKLKFFSTLFFLLNNNGYPLFNIKYNGYGLDINGKDGISIKEIENNFPYTTFYGVDNDRKKIIKLQKEYPSHNFLYKNIENGDIRNLYKKFQVIQISEYNNLENMLRNTNKLLQEDSVCILRYKEKDILKIKKIVQNSHYQPKQHYLGMNYDIIHHLPGNLTVVFFK